MFESKYKDDFKEGDIIRSEGLRLCFKVVGKITIYHSPKDYSSGSSDRTHYVHCVDHRGYNYHLPLSEIKHSVEDNFEEDKVVDPTDTKDKLIKVVLTEMLDQIRKASIYVSSEEDTNKLKNLIDSL